MEKTREYAYVIPDNYHKKSFWRAAGEWTMTQVLPWAVNYFIRKAAFAKISFGSISHNLDPYNLQWDDNRFFNNQFSHPYQGGLYFNAFRNNNYNFWQSIPAVIAGTFTWETTGETHFPAPNDLINTSLGGIAFGEMSYRVSKKILSGRKRNDITVPLTFLVNPINSVNAMLDGEWRRKNGHGSGDDPVSFVTDAGVRRMTIKGNSKVGKDKNEAFGSIHLQYGDRFGNSKKPFSHFSIIAEAGNSDSGKINVLQIEGSLYDRKIKQTDYVVHNFNVSIDYEFFQNSLFIYSAQSFKGKLDSRFVFSKNLQLLLKGDIGIIALAAVPNPYMYYGEGRNYDYCVGVSTRAGAEINIGNRLFYQFNCSAAGLQTVDGYKSVHLFCNNTSLLRLVMYRKFSITAGSDNYYFNSYYKNYPNASKYHQFLHFGLGYKTTF